MKIFSPKIVREISYVSKLVKEIYFLVFCVHSFLPSNGTAKNIKAISLKLLKISQPQSNAKILLNIGDKAQALVNYLQMDYQKHCLWNFLGGTGG